MTAKKTPFKVWREFSQDIAKVYAVNKIVFAKQFPKTEKNALNRYMVARLLKAARRMNRNLLKIEI